MDLNSILKEKKEKNTILKTKYSLAKKHKAIWLIKISNKTLIRDLRDAFLVLPSNFILEVEWAPTEKLWENILATDKINNADLIAFDFIIVTDEITWLNKYFELWITPIVSWSHCLKSVLTEFNPMKNEWNSYIFSKDDKWSIFYAINRYLENYKFPFDNKNLVKNVLDI